MNREFAFVIGAIAFSCALAGRCRGEWITYQHDLQNTGRSDASWNPQDLTYSWTSPAGFAAPIVQNGRVYASRVINGSPRPTVEYAAFDLASGQQLWTNSVKWTANAAAVLDGMLVSFDFDNHLRVYDAVTGSLLHDTVHGGMGSNLSSPALVDVPGNGNVEAYFCGSNGFTKFNITRTASSVAWQFNDQSTGGTPTVAGESIISTGPGAFVAYRRSDGVRNLFYSGPITGGAVSTGLYDETRHRFYSEETHATDGDALTAWNYTNNGQVTFLWKIVNGPRGFSSAAMDSDGDLWFVDQTNLLREYSPDGQLLRSSTMTFQSGSNTPVIQNGYLWMNDSTQTYAIDLDTLLPVRTLSGKNAGGNGFRSSGIILDEGFILDRGGGSSGFDVYVVPEPATAAASLISLLVLATERRRLP